MMRWHGHQMLRCQAKYVVPVGNILSGRLIRRAMPPDHTINPLRASNRWPINEIDVRGDEFSKSGGQDIMSWLFAPFAVLLGVVLTTQVATNTLLGKALGNDYIPAAVNMAIGLVATAVLTWSLTSQWPSREMMRAAPWYVWFAGGLMGTIYLTGNILLAPRLGAGELVGLLSL